MENTLTKIFDTEKLLLELLDFQFILKYATLSKKCNEIAKSLTEYKQLIESQNKFDNAYQYALIEWALKNNNQNILKFAKIFPPKEKFSKAELTRKGIYPNFMLHWINNCRSEFRHMHIHRSILFLSPGKLQQVAITSIGYNANPIEVYNVFMVSDIIASLYANTDVNNIVTSLYGNTDVNNNTLSTKYKYIPKLIMCCCNYVNSWLSLFITYFMSK